MKPDFLLCLALVLGGGLMGCSTAPGGALSYSAEGTLFSNQEAVCLQSDNFLRPWNLKYALTEDTWNEGELFLTVHERTGTFGQPDYASESTVAIYVKIGNQFKLLQRLATDGLSGYLKPEVIWVASGGEDRKQLIQITERFHGTGGLTREHIFTTSSGKEFAPDLQLEEVEFTPAWESYSFGQDEGVWKNANSTLTDDGLSFEFVVWKYENKTNYPVGKVTGTYKLERKPDGKWRIIMDRFKREPIMDSHSS